MAGEPTLARGRVNDEGWVVYLQERLAAEGFDPGAADGVFGPRTEAAVREYQREHGLEVDGIVGRQTWASLEGEDPQPPGESDDGSDASEWFEPWEGGGGAGGGGQPTWPEGSGSGDGGGGGGGDGGDGGDSGDADADIDAPLQLSGMGLGFGVANTGTRPWRPGEVIYDLYVLNEASSMVTQLVNDHLPNGPDGSMWVWHPLATDQPGRYTAGVTLSVNGVSKPQSTLDFELYGDSAPVDEPVDVPVEEPYEPVEHDGGA